MKKLTKTQQKEQEFQMWKDAANSMFRFIQRNPPEGFNTCGLVWMALAGRIEEIPAMLDGFTKEVQEQAKKEAAEASAKLNAQKEA